MNTKESASAQEKVIFRSSTSASSTDSPLFHVRSMTAPVARFFTRQRVNDWPFPGLTNWCSTMANGTPSIWIFRPLRMSVVCMRRRTR